MTPPVDSTPRPVDSLRVDTVATGGPIIVPPDTTPTPPPVGDFAVASHMPATGMQPWVDTDMSDLDPRAEYASPQGLRYYPAGSDQRFTDPSAPYGAAVHRVSYPGNSTGDGYEVGSLQREEGVWPRMYVAAMVKLVGSNGQPYRIHANEEKWLFPVLRCVNNGPQDNSGPDFAWILRDGQWQTHMQNGIGSPRLVQNRAGLSDQRWPVEQDRALHPDEHAGEQ